MLLSNTSGHVQVQQGCFVLAAVQTQIIILQVILCCTGTRGQGVNQLDHRRSQGDVAPPSE